MSLDTMAVAGSVRDSLFVAEVLLINSRRQILRYSLLNKITSKCYEAFSIISLKHLILKIYLSPSQILPYARILCNSSPSTLKVNTH